MREPNHFTRTNPLLSFDVQMISNWGIPSLISTTYPWTKVIYFIIQILLVHHDHDRWTISSLIVFKFCLGLWAPPRFRCSTLIFMQANLQKIHDSNSIFHNWLLLLLIYFVALRPKFLHNNKELWLFSFFGA